MKKKTQKRVLRLLSQQIPLNRPLSRQMVIYSDFKRLNLFYLFLKLNYPGNKADSSLHKIRFNCDRCGYGFGAKKSLAKHTRTVNCKVVPWFRCTLCGKYLKKRKHFKRHLLSAHKHNVASSQFMDYIIEPALTCSVCSYRCETLINLQKHMKFYH